MVKMKKRTNRLAALFAAMAVSVSLLAGCAKSDAKKEDTSTASAASTATEASKDEIKTTEESKTDASADQYVLNMGYNSECVDEKGFAFFFHCFRINRTYTGGCVGVPENIMKFIMQYVKPGCKITIDSLKNFGGDLDA